MKIIKIITLTIIWFVIYSGITNSQDIAVHNMIGKQQNEVITKFGNPVHKDNSNPDMVCMFYKSANRTLVFVADKNSVYQAEANAIYDTESGARNSLDEFIKSSVAGGFITDTVTVNDFKVHKPKVSVELHFSENKVSNKFEIRVKANRTEN